MNTRSEGTKYEIKAVEYLKTHDYTILETNFRCKMGEIDIIARDKEYLVFIEVKYRKDSKKGIPLETVTYRKMKRISMTAAYYLMKSHLSTDTAIRFDVIGFLGDEMQHIQNAFDYMGPQ